MNLVGCHRALVPGQPSLATSCCTRPGSRTTSGDCVSSGTQRDGPAPERTHRVSRVLDADVSAIGRHQLVMEPLFALGSGLKRDDDRAHVAPPHGRALTAAMAVLQ